MHNHIEAGGSFIIKTAIAHFSLPAVNPGIKDVPASVIGETGIFQVLVKL